MSGRTSVGQQNEVIKAKGKDFPHIFSGSCRGVELLSKR